jgi:hypothetical protein
MKWHSHVNYHSSIRLPWCLPTWTNPLPRHFRRGLASHKPFDFLPSIYTFYMFYTAKILVSIAEFATIIPNES